METSKRHLICWICWAGGAILIFLSRIDVVPPALGWAGVLIAGLAVLVSYLPVRPQTIVVPDLAVLTTSMLESHDAGFAKAMSHFQAGGDVFWDGISFGIRGSEVALSTVSHTPRNQLDDSAAIREAESVTNRFQIVLRSAREVAVAAAERTLRVSLMSPDKLLSREICRVAAGRVQWKFREEEARAQIFDRGQTP
jgi:hypothetical protein